MKNKILLLVSILILSLFQSLNAQQKAPFDPTNAREGEQVEYCQTHKKMAQLMKDPEFVKAMEKQEAELQSIILSKKSGSTKSTVYKIPVVFHVLQNGGIENISDEQIMDALTILNRDFRKLNADANTVQPDFQGMPTDSEIEFVLATKAPNGTCFKGITRTLSPLSFQGDNGTNQVNAIRNGNDVYQGNWAGNKYLNIFICGEIGGAAGYTTNPNPFSGTSMGNGIWILHNYVGSIGTGSENGSRALTHEVGHWLNLSHTWGPNNNPGTASSCSTDDQVEDTPNCIGVTACLLNSNSCTETGSYWSFDVKDNVENYMDYSYCSKMYTQGQVDRMRAALTQTTTGRANLWSTANLNSTGATGSLFLCKAEFNADKQSVCVGEQVQLIDDSYNVVTGWTWEITPSTGWAYASGSSATSQNPVLIFSQSGLFTVKLTATDGTTSNANTKSNYLRVLPVAATIPYWEGFEDYSTLNDLTNWEITNQNNNNKYELETTTGYSGTKCAKLTNFGQAASNIDDLTSSTIDLSSIPSNGSVTLSFRYSYRKKAAANYEYLKVFITGDCGTSWAQRKTLGGNQLSSVAVATAWKPTQQSDWATVHMVNVTNTYFTDGFKMRFRFEGEGGNNFYLDDINLYAGSPSDNLVLGVSDLNDFGSLELFPNPTDDELNLRFTLDKKEDVTFMITDVSGKVAQKHIVKANEGSNLLLFDTKDLSSGMYFLTIGTANSSKTMQFVVK